jgi:hypothetical protein
VGFEGRGGAGRKGKWRILHLVWESAFGGERKKILVINNLF